MLDFCLVKGFAAHPKISLLIEFQGLGLGMKKYLRQSLLPGSTNQRAQ